MWKNYEKMLNEDSKPSREARLSALVATIRGHLADTSLSADDCLAAIEDAIMQHDIALKNHP